MNLMTPEQIKLLREKTGLTLREFGEIAHVSESCVSLWESGRRHPTYSKMQRLNEIAAEYGLKQPSPVS